jgi:hypothetical protein
MVRQNNVSQNMFAKQCSPNNVRQTTIRQNYAADAGIFASGPVLARLA